MNVVVNNSLCGRWWAESGNCIFLTYGKSVLPFGIQV